jgi:hypothetical protein
MQRNVGRRVELMPHVLPCSRADPGAVHAVRSATPARRLRGARITHLGDTPLVMLPAIEECGVLAAGAGHRPDSPVMRDATIIHFPQHGREPWVDKQVVARHLGFSTRWVELRMHEGLPFERPPGSHRPRYHLSAVESWLEAGRSS